MRFGKAFNSGPQQPIHSEGRSPEEEIVDLYAHYNQPDPGEDISSLLARDPVQCLEVEEALKEIHALRGSNIPLRYRFFLRSIAYKIRNLSEIRLVTPCPNGANMEGFSFNGSDLHNNHFSDVNFSAADFTNAELAWTEFYGSVLNTAALSSIKIDGKRIDTLDRVVGVKDGLWEIRKTTIEKVGDCGDCEKLNEKILRTPGEGLTTGYERRGILLFQEGEPLGYMKLKGDKSFLAIRTVMNASGETVLWKGMVYAFERPVRTALLELSEPYENSQAWRRIDLENFESIPTKDGSTLTHLGRNNLRFISDPELYPLMTDLVDSINAGIEPMVDILT